MVRQIGGYRDGDERKEINASENNTSNRTLRTPKQNDKLMMSTICDANQMITRRSRIPNMNKSFIKLCCSGESSFIKRGTNLSSSKKDDPKQNDCSYTPKITRTSCTNSRGKLPSSNKEISPLKSKTRKVRDLKDKTSIANHTKSPNEETNKIIKAKAIKSKGETKTSKAKPIKCNGETKTSKAKPIKSKGEIKPNKGRTIQSNEETKTSKVKPIKCNQETKSTKVKTAQFPNRETKTRKGKSTNFQNSSTIKSKRLKLVSSRSQSKVRSISANDINELQDKEAKNKQNEPKSQIITHHKTLRNISVQKIKSANNNVSSGLSDSIYQPKLPIWNMKVKKGERISKRLSQKGIYEFITDGTSSGEKVKVNSDIPNIPKRNKARIPKRNKARKRITSKNKFKSCLKTTLLTTDLSWQVPFFKTIPVSSFYSRKEVESEVSEVERLEIPPFTSSFQTPSSSVDDVGYDASVSEVNDTNHISVTIDYLTQMNQTIDTPSAGINQAIVANNPQSACFIPTPKIMGRFPGTTSTPREPHPFEVSSSSMVVPACVQEEVKLCFGFDGPEESEANLGFSPVYKPPHMPVLGSLSSSSASDVGEIDPLPTRFAVPYRKALMPAKCTPSLKSSRGDQSLMNSLKPPNTESMGNPSTLFEVDGIADAPTENLISNFNLPEQCQEDREPDNTNLSPEKCIPQPPRRSYTRKGIEAAKRKMQVTLAGGYPTTDSEVEEDENDAESTVMKKRRNLKLPLRVSEIRNTHEGTKTKSKKASKMNKERKTRHTLKQLKVRIKKTASKKNMECKPSKTQDKITCSKSKNAGKENLLHYIKKTKTVNIPTPIELDKSVEDWVSDVNSHFSEIDDHDLLVE